MDKKELKKKVVSTVLAGSLIFATGAGINTKANAYNLNKPTVSYEEFNDYSGVKIFINGRLVEFNDDLGYPYIDKEKGRTMIPLRAVAETFGSTVSYDSLNRQVSITRFNDYARLKINDNYIYYYDFINPTQKIKMDTNAIIKNDRTYIPLRALFECFGLTVRWDSKNKIAHIETLDENTFNNIDFKDKKIIHINDIDLSDVNKVVYDEVEVDKSYVNILKNSDQYKVFVENGVAYIFSYQFLSNLNYLYSKEKELVDIISSDETYVELRYLLKDEAKFFYRISKFDEIDEDTQLMNIPESIGRYYMAFRHGEKEKEKYILAKSKAKEIANEIKKQSTDKEKQIKLANDYICECSNYYINDTYTNGSAYNVFFEGKSFCRGYQSAFKMIMDELGITCVNVLGTWCNIDHTWSEVLINDQWKLVDVTANDSAIDVYLLRDIDDIKDHVVTDECRNDIELFKLTYKFK